MSYNYINYRGSYARFDEEKRTLDIGGEQGAILSGLGITVHTRDLNHVYQAITPADYSSVYCAHEKHLASNGLSVCFCGGPEALPFFILRVILSADGADISLEAERDSDYFYDIHGHAVWGANPESDTFAMYSVNPGNGLRCAIGPAAARGCDSLFDRLTDRLLVLSPAPAYRYDYDAGCYGFTERLGCGNMSFSLRTVKDFMKNRFGMNYRPMNNNTVFTRPPVGWMTWYAVRFGACESAVLENSAVQKEKLAAYGADAIWVDWEWYHKDFGDYNGDFDSFTPDAGKYPHGMKYVSDRIKEDGFVPCIWIGASHDVRENRFLKEHPESLLVKRPSWCGDYWFDPTNPDYLNSFIPEVFSQLTEKWGYGAIKWDALPRALDYFDQYHDRFFDTSVTSEQAMRNVVKKARETVGDRVYMLSCHGEGERDIMLYSDVFDAARIGADIFSWDNFIESGVRRLLGFYFLHNIAEYCDPDNLVVREEFNTCDQAVSRASLFSLLGTPITLGDDLRELSDGRIGIIRRAIPPMNTHPMIPDRCALPDECLVVGCFVRTRSDEYQIADIFNMRERPVTYRLDFSGLDLEPEAEYLVYDFWNRRFLGKLRHSVTVSLPACGSAVLSVRRVTGIPQLVATSRHITQGAFDVLYCGWDPDTRTFSGRSRTVPGDEYTVTVYDPLADRTAEVTLTPDGTETDWSITL